MKLWILALFLISTASAQSGAVEVFAKGSLSRSALSRSNYILNVSASTGLAFTLFPRVRIEARYTNSSSLQDALNIDVAMLTGIKTETQIGSLGLDIDILGEKSTFQPFVYLGGGYVVTARSYYVTETGSETSILVNEPKQTGFSVNAGAGFRIRLARSLAFEIEAFGYAVNVDKPDPLINLMGSVGIRLYI